MTTTAVSVRSNAAAKSRVLHPDEMPERYAIICEGDCMSPEIVSGAKLIFSRDAACAPGDFVALFLRPEVVPEGEHQVVVKRLVLAPPAWAQWGNAARGDVAPIVIVEMSNPHRQFYIPCEKLLGMHKCESVAPRAARRASKVGGLA